MTHKGRPELLLAISQEPRSAETLAYAVITSRRLVEDGMACRSRAEPCPAFGVAWAWMFLDERSRRAPLGAAVVLFGVAS